MISATLFTSLLCKSSCQRHISWIFFHTSHVSPPILSRWTKDQKLVLKKLVLCYLLQQDKILPACNWQTIATYTTKTSHIFFHESMDRTTISVNDKLAETRQHDACSRWAHEANRDVNSPDDSSAITEYSIEHSWTPPHPPPPPLPLPIPLILVPLSFDWWVLLQNLAFKVERC